MTNFTRNRDGQWGAAPIQGRVVDVGCPDFERAAENRVIVAEHLFVEFYHRLENWLRHTPKWTPLPDWIPLGKISSIGERDWKENAGGFHPTSTG